MKKLKSNLFIATFVLLIIACQNEQKPNEVTSDTTPKKEMTPTKPVSNSEALPPPKMIEPLQTKDLVYAWVDKLNIRNAPNLKGKAIASVDSNDALEFTGTKSGKAETIVLRGVAYTDLWYKIVTKGGTEGWVYGGAVKRKGEKKGNAEITDKKFDFLYFGKYDLSTWKKISTKSEGEEIDITITTYQKGNQYLEITQSDRGEFYYGYDYRLLDKNKKTLKVRNFSFVPADESGKSHEIIEEVKDYTQNPPQQYARIQKIDVHYYNLKPRPVMALGNWKVEAIDAPMSAAGNIGKVSIQLIDYQKCKIIAAADSGCSCNFRVGKDYQSDEIFTTDFDKNGCINLNGKTYELKGGFIGDTNILFENDKYSVTIEVKEVGKDDGGGSKYEGTIQVNSRKNGDLLAEQKVWGGCGC